MIKEMMKTFYSYNMQRYELVAPNVYPDWRFGEMDIMGIRPSNFVDEIEIKLSKSDFLADFRKTVNIECNPYFDDLLRYTVTWQKQNKHECLAMGLNHCNYFSFFMPEELAEKCIIPKHAGLYIFKTDSKGYSRIIEVKKAPRLHSRKISLELKYKIARKLAYRFWSKGQ